jgi:hypothetical protein
MPQRPRRESAFFMTLQDRRWPSDREDFPAPGNLSRVRTICRRTSPGHDAGVRSMRTTKSHGDRLRDRPERAREPPRSEDSSRPPMRPSRDVLVTRRRPGPTLPREGLRNNPTPRAAEKRMRRHRHLNGEERSTRGAIHEEAIGRRSSSFGSGIRRAGDDSRRGGARRARRLGGRVPTHASDGCHPSAGEPPLAAIDRTPPG